MKLNREHIETVIRLANGSPFFQLMGMRLTGLDFGASFVEVEIDRARHYNPFGAPHGGLYSALIDTACYWAAYCDQPADGGMVSIDLNVENLAVAGSEIIRASGRLVKNGRRLGFATAEATDENGKLLAVGGSKMLFGEGLQSIANLAEACGETPPPKFI